MFKITKIINYILIIFLIFIVNIIASEELIPKDDYEKYILNYMGPEKLREHRETQKNKKTDNVAITNVATTDVSSQINASGMPSANIMDNFKTGLAMMDKISEEDLVKSMNEKVSKSALGFILINNPKLMLFFVRSMKDKNVIQELMASFTNKEKYKQYILIMGSTALFFFILSFIICRNSNLIEKMFKKILLTICMLGTQLLILSLLFPKSASAMSKIFYKTFIV
ncbi:MAG: hypothetical protein HQK51_00360 [Oligoflexia bacterium]|nr:hypothetical protein [Oligoflexia bacterium]